MLGVKEYPKDYINFCKRKIKNDLVTFEQLKSITSEFEQSYFNNMVLVLETIFMHRLRGQEGKDGNPLNEVRMLANSLLTNNGKLAADKTIKYNAEKAVLGIQLDQEIVISAGDFAKLSEVFFKSIEEKFSK